jgi:hypothetical protein
MNGLFRSSPKIIINKPTLSRSALATEWKIEEWFVTQDIINTKTLTLSYTPVNNSEVVLQNGLECSKYPPRDYIISGSVIIFNSDTELTIGDFIEVKYEKLV